MEHLKEIIKKRLKFVKILKAKIKYFLYTIECKIRKQNQYILCSVPVHGNLGDHAITFSEEKLLYDCKIKVMEIPTFDTDFYIKMLRKKLPKSATILINGGGFLGSHWFDEEKNVRKIISNFSSNRIIIFPQTIFYSEDAFGREQLEESKQIYNAHRNLTIFARENKSFLIMKEAYPNCNIIKMPDMVMYLDVGEKEKKRTNILFCLRKDKEKRMNAKELDNIVKIINEKNIPIVYTDTVIKKRVSKITRKRQLIRKLNELKKSKVVITDRLHGMIFAYLTRTPCIVFRNYNYKVKEVYKWIEESNYIVFLENIEDFEKEFNKLLELKEKKCVKYFNEFDLLKKKILEEQQ